MADRWLKDYRLDHRDRLFEEQRGRCHWCRRKCIPSHAHMSRRNPRLFTLDHVIPLCHGGGDYAGNYVGACLECNGRRGTADNPNNSEMPNSCPIGL